MPGPNTCTVCNGVISENEDILFNPGEGGPRHADIVSCIKRLRARIEALGG